MNLELSEGIIVAALGVLGVVMKGVAGRLVDVLARLHAIELHLTKHDNNFDTQHLVKPPRRKFLGLL